MGKWKFAVLNERPSGIHRYPVKGIETEQINYIQSDCKSKKK